MCCASPVMKLLATWEKARAEDGGRNFGSPVRAREDKLNWVDGGALEDLPRPVFG